MTVFGRARVPQPGPSPELQLAVVRALVDRVDAAAVDGLRRLAVTRYRTRGAADGLLDVLAELRGIHAPAEEVTGRG